MKGLQHSCLIHSWHDPTVYCSLFSISQKPYRFNIQNLLNFLYYNIVPSFDFLTELNCYFVHFANLTLDIARGTKS